MQWEQIPIFYGFLLLLVYWYIYYAIVAQAHAKCSFSFESSFIDFIVSIFLKIEKLNCIRCVSFWYFISQKMYTSIQERRLSEKAGWYRKKKWINTLNPGAASDVDALKGIYTNAKKEQNKICCYKSIHGFVLSRFPYFYIFFCFGFFFLCAHEI